MQAGGRDAASAGVQACACGLLGSEIDSLGAPSGGSERARLFEGPAREEPAPNEQPFHRDIKSIILLEKRTGLGVESDVPTRPRRSQALPPENVLCASSVSVLAKCSTLRR